MAKEVIMPKFSMTQEVGKIAHWLRAAGDVVEKGEPIAEVETDKVNMEIEAPADGILGGIRYQAGDEVPVTVVIAYILAEGEDAPAGQASAGATPAEPAPEPQRTAAVSATPVAQRMAAETGIDLAQVAGSGPGGRITRGDVERHLAAASPPSGNGKVRATPAARRIAREHNIALVTVAGSGPNGRIQAADVQTAATQDAVPTSPAMAAPSGTPTIFPLEGMRRTIADRMQASYQQAPHILFSADIDMTRARELRQTINARLPEGEPPVSMTAILVRMCAWTLRQHPIVNSHFRDGQIWLMPTVNVGVAVALDDGLIVPVIHHADQKGLRVIGAEVHELAARARAGRLRPQDMMDGTFTVSNLGMYGIDHFTAIINPPEVAILSVGRIAKRFMPDDNDQPVALPLMTVTLAVDHRVIDGAVAAQFVATLKAVLEEPVSLLM
ncbi:MAG: 2-oxo acid dehydrogenase subunit E2 [Chloroflexi bacterium]|nr:2-oxo acid dehydrogenase subunit E2 [Chloroflexota bacterium]